MNRRTRVNLKSRNVSAHYSTWLRMLIMFISPKNLFLVAGRATSKTADIMAERFMQVCYDMPGSYQVIVADTYTNALSNIAPTLLEGLKRKGWQEGIHYVVDERPPSHFKNPYKPPLSYKHTISVFNGCFIQIGSLDQPSGLAGGSFQHVYGDEARVLKFIKLKKLNPAIRGEYALFGHSIFYRGRTFTTDIPNIVEGDDDWIMQQEKNMDLEQIKLALLVGSEINDIKKELISAAEFRDKKKIELLKRNLIRWTERWLRVRKNSTFFYMVSSFVNADILTEGYFEDALESLGIEEFKSAILSLKVDIKKGEKFYGSLGEHHFYDDGVINSYYDKFKLTDEIQESSLALRYIDHNAKLEAGVDFGDMCSMVTAQPRGNYLYCLKEFYTLAPENEVQMGKKFRDFYALHKNKVLDMYYDRSGNQNSKTKRDWASAFKKSIEYDEKGKSTGWVVNLMSLNQGTIYQEEEYNFAKNLMGEYVPGLIKLKIDRFLCKNLKSSLELAKIIVKTDRKGSKTIHKNKSSEKLPLHALPMYSTNFSDAFKYLVYRSSFVKKVNTHSQYKGMDPSTH